MSPFELHSNQDHHCINILQRIFLNLSVFHASHVSVPGASAWTHLKHRNHPPRPQKCPRVLLVHDHPGCRGPDEYISAKISSAPQNHQVRSTPRQATTPSVISKTMLIAGDPNGSRHAQPFADDTPLRSPAGDCSCGQYARKRQTGRIAANLNPGGVQ